MRIKHIAINNILLAEVKGLETAYTLKSTADALRICYTIGLTKYALLKAKDANDRGITDVIADQFPTPNSTKIELQIPAQTQNSTFKVFIDDSALMLIRFIKADFPYHYSFSRIYSYLVFLGINEIISRGYFVPAQHISYNVDKNNVLRDL